MSKAVSSFLVLYPLLNIYCLPGLTSLSISHVFILLLFSYALLTGRKFQYNLPKGFGLYWCYISITYILLAHSFSFGLLMPAGYAFCIWVLLFWLCCNFLDFRLFKKYYRIIFICCSIVFLCQELCYSTMGSRPLFMLPLPFYGVDRLEIITNQTLLDRSSCFFIEPSHFAQFALPLLAIEIFNSSKEKILNTFSFYIIIVLFLLQSGNGLVGIMILLSIRMLTYLKYSHKRNKHLIFLLFIIFAALAVNMYIGTGIGSGIMERALGLGFSEDSESSTRTIKGYFLFSELPLKNKIYGYHINSIESFAASCKYYYLFRSAKSGEFSLYLNGFQHVLIINGCIGTILFFRVWRSLYKGKDLLSKSLIVMFILLMFISYQYISQMMLICMLIPYKFKSKNQTCC